MAQREPREQREPARISSEQFQRDPRAAGELADRDGRVIITNAQGRPIAAISVPADERPVCLDC